MSAVRALLQAILQMTLRTFSWAHHSKLAYGEKEQDLGKLIHGKGKKLRNNYLSLLTKFSYQEYQSECTQYLEEAFRHINQSALILSCFPLFLHCYYNRSKIAKLVSLCYFFTYNGY